MIESPMDVLQQFPVRKTGKQKQAFRDAVQSYARTLGYQTDVEKRNIIIGDPETAGYLITAHYDTPAGWWVPSLLVPFSLPLSILSQILVAAALFLPAVLVTAVTAYLVPDRAVWYPVLLAMLALTLVLMAAGPASRRSANGSTSGVVTLLETAASMPKNLRGRVCFVLFDGNEPAMTGACFHRRAHRCATDMQTVLNLDCVGEGNTIVFIPDKRVKADDDILDRLIDLERVCGDKQVLVRDRGFAFLPSGHTVFPRGIGICALGGKKDRVIGKVHTFRDVCLDHTNVNILRACLISFIGSARDD